MKFQHAFILILVFQMSSPICIAKLRAWKRNPHASHAQDIVDVERKEEWSRIRKLREKSDEKYYRFPAEAYPEDEIPAVQIVSRYDLKKDYPVPNNILFLDKKFPGSSILAKVTVNTCHALGAAQPEWNEHAPSASKLRPRIDRCLEKTGGNERRMLTCLTYETQKWIEEVGTKKQYFQKVHSRGKEPACKEYSATLSKMINMWSRHSGKCDMIAAKPVSLTPMHAVIKLNFRGKSREVPELKKEVQKGNINLSAAKRISSVIEPENKDKWLDMASKLPQRKLEENIVKENPREQIKNHIKPIQSDLLELRCSISEKVEKMIKRVQDLESTRQKRSITLEEAIEAMARLYIDKLDPVEKAKRSKKGASKKTVPSNRSGIRYLPEKPSRKVPDTHPYFKVSLRTGIPKPVLHAVHQRDQGQCAFVDHQGKRCQNQRFLNLHHIKPVSVGGSQDQNNLVTLCSSHHQAIHAGLTGFRLRI